MPLLIPHKKNSSINYVSYDQTKVLRESDFRSEACAVRVSQKWILNILQLKHLVIEPLRSTVLYGILCFSVMLIVPYGAPHFNNSRQCIVQAHCKIINNSLNYLFSHFFNSYKCDPLCSRNVDNNIKSHI
jgi:hypothetical protein